MKNFALNKFSQLSKIKASILVQPKNFLNSILIQKCFKENLLISDVILIF